MQGTGDLKVSILSTYSPKNILKDKLTFGHALFFREEFSSCSYNKNEGNHEEFTCKAPTPADNQSRSVDTWDRKRRGLPLRSFPSPMSSNLCSPSNQFLRSEKQQNSPENGRLC